jgi:acyl carrier protein
MMTDGQIEQMVLKLVGEILPQRTQARTKLTPDQHLRRDLGLDSLGLVALLVAFEKRFGVDVTKVDDLDPARIQTVGDAIAFGSRLARHVAEPDGVS